jgi:hypothetical protein
VKKLREVRTGSQLSSCYYDIQITETAISLTCSEAGEIQNGLQNFSGQPLQSGRGDRRLMFKILCKETFCEGGM